MKSLRSIVLGILIFFNTSCNVFEELGDDTTDEARLIEAKRLMNDAQYSLTLEQFALMSAAFLERRDVKVRHASAYAGLCGMDFLVMLNILENLGSNRLFPGLMTNFTGATADNVQACIQAQDKLLEISALGSARTEDENFLMAFISFAKIGVIVSATADTDANGVADAGFDSCQDDQIAEANVRQVVTALIHLISSITALGSQDDVAGGALESFQELMNEIQSTPPGFDICEDDPDGSGDCANTNPDDVDPALVAVMRTMIKEDEVIGVGTCDSAPDNQFVDCPCP